MAIRTDQMNQAMQDCIQQCLHCYSVCLHEAMTHCLEVGGKHAEPQHMRLMLDCAEICRTSAHFMLSGSEMHQHTCRACAEVCDACAQSCADVGDMERCEQACRSCAEVCRTMAEGSAS